MMEKKEFWIRVCDWTAAGTLLALTLYVVIRYIAGPSLAYIHSDCTDSLLWSLATAETGEILSEDFFYAALLPFGSSLWTTPILAVCGFSVRAYILSMSVFAVLFAAAAFSLFRAMKWRPCAAGAAAFCLSMLLSGSNKLREMLWEHTIYYSLSILLTLLLLNLCLRLLPCLEAWKKGEKNPRNTRRIAVFGGLLALLCVGCAADGFQVLAVSVVPVAGALIACTVLDGETRLLSRPAANRAVPVILMAAGTAAGLGVLRIITHGGVITAGYETAYSNWSALDTWTDNAMRFLPQYLSLFGIQISQSQPLFSGESMLTLLKLFAALTLLICPVLLLVRYRRLRHLSSRLAAWTHAVVAAVILLGYVCGALSAANWRLTPLLGSSILATAVYLRELFLSSGVGKRVGAILTALLLSVSMMHAFAIAAMPRHLGDYREQRVIAAMLENKEYDYGYATFWNAHITRLFADDRVKILPVMVSDDNIAKHRYQTKDSWFEARTGESCFLLLTDEEYETVTQGWYWSRLNESHELIEDFSYGGYRVLVFDGNVLEFS